MKILDFFEFIVRLITANYGSILISFIVLLCYKGNKDYKDMNRLFQIVFIILGVCVVIGGATFADYFFRIYF